VVANIALAVILLSGAGLLLESIRNLLSQKLGFQPENVMTMAVNLTGTQFDDHARVDSYYAQILERIHALPGVQSAGIVSQLPLSANIDMYGIEVRDKPLANRGEAPSAERFAISPGYLRALRIPVLRGRGITREDHAQSTPVVLVNRTFAQTFWPSEAPLGKQIHIGEPERPWRTVVGVVEDVRHRGLQEPFAMQFYMPFQQWSDSTMTVVVRTSIESQAAAEEIRNAIWSIDRNQPVSEVATMRQVVDATLAQKKFAMQLIQFFAIVALFLAAVGVYGVMAYSVTARFQELGVRMALGADRTSVVSLILKKGFMLTLFGIALGLAGSMLLLRLIETMLFRVQPGDPAILSAVGVILLSVAILACSIPALRASRVDPLLALRHD
jgi:putative ABC transport system permease protein